MDEEELQKLYAWIDEIPLSRPKRNVTRDFGDGVLVAETVLHFIPRLVDMHNYPPANSTKQKLANWQTLQQKVFKKLGLVVPANVINGVINSKPGVVEVVLNNLRQKVEEYLAKDEPAEEPAPEYPQYSAEQQAMMMQMLGYPVDPLMIQHMQQQLQMQQHMGIPPPAFAPPGQQMFPPHAASVGGYDQQPQQPVHKSKLPAEGGRSQLPVGSPSSKHGGGAGKGARTGASRGAVSPTKSAKSLAPSMGELEKDQSMMEMEETVEILQVKVRKLEQLVKLKDRRIDDLQAKLQAHGIVD